jgi:hypothetical protein
VFNIYSQPECFRQRTDKFLVFVRLLPAQMMIHVQDGEANLKLRCKPVKYVKKNNGIGPA